MQEPIRILMLFTIMNRGGAETMVMNYYRNIDRTKVQFDFMVHREERGAYDDEIEAMGGKVTGTVTGKTFALINNDVTSNSSKNKKARELNVEILTEREFWDRYVSG